MVACEDNVGRDNCDDGGGCIGGCDGGGDCVCIRKTSAIVREGVLSFLFRVPEVGYEEVIGPSI